MHVAAGKLPLGRCEILDGEGVVTQFFFLGPILVPTDSVYALKVWSARGPAIPVKRSGKSIALAYVRWAVAPLVLAFTFIGFAGDKAGPPELSLSARVTLGVLAAAWLALVVLAGRTRGAAARQRRVLASFVGHGAPPELLFDGAQAMALDDLEQLWREHGDASYRSDGAAAVSWRELYPKDVPPRAMALYYALCRYEAARSDDHIMGNRARLAWKRLEENWSALAPSLVRRPVVHEVLAG